MAQTHLPVNKTESPFDLTGAQWKACSTKKRNLYLDDAVQYWRTRGFPYYDLSSSEIRTELLAVTRIKINDVIFRNKICGSNVGLRLANYFHPQMWTVKVSRYKSPMDCFRDDDCLRAAIERAFNLWPDRHGANASCVRRILKSFSNCAAVSNFRPAIARALIAKYTLPGDRVVDFSAGYGGRLVGSLSLGCHYVGIEPCAPQVRGLSRCAAVIQKLGVAPGSAEIQRGCAEEELPKLPSRSAQLVLSSPPYFDWEKYSYQGTQSFVRYGSYSEWLNGFLAPAIGESYRILTLRGLLALNLPAHNRIPLLADVKQLASSIGFRIKTEYQMRLSKIPYLHPRTQDSKWETLAVFQK